MKKIINNITVKKLIILTVLILLIITSCKKYPDGPLISFRKPMNRLMGKWKVEYVGINNNDATQLYFDSCGCDFYFDVKEHSPTNVVMINCNNYYSNYGTYKFNSNKIINIFIDSRRYSDSLWNYNYYPIFGPFKVTTSSDWDVRKLSNTKLWMENNYNGKIYLFKMEKYAKY